MLASVRQSALMAGRRVRGFLAPPAMLPPSLRAAVARLVARHATGSSAACGQDQVGVADCRIVNGRDVELKLSDGSMCRLAGAQLRDGCTKYVLVQI